MATRTKAEPVGPMTVIEPAEGIHWPNMGELWRYRDTLYFLARRDIAVRYKQTVVGLVWVILQPIAFALVYSAFLSLIGSVPSHGRAVRRLRLDRDDGLAVLLDGPHARERLDRLGRGADLQDLVPAAHHPAISDRAGSHRSRGVEPGPLGGDAHLRRRSRSQDPAAARRCPGGRLGRARHRPVVQRDIGALPRHPAARPVPLADPALPHADHLSVRGRPRSAADDLLVQSAGRA